MNHTQTKQESTYLTLFKEGDTRAFAFFFDLYWEELYTAAYRHLRDEDLAKDVVQDVFIQVWEKRHLIDGAYESLRPYFYKAVKNKVLNYYATERVRQDVLEKVSYGADIFDSSDPNSLAVYEKLEGLVDDAVSKLPKLMQAVYRLRNDNLSIQQIAQQLDIAEQTVKNYLSDAKKMLKKDLAKRFADHDRILVLLIGSYCVHNLLT